MKNVLKAIVINGSVFIISCLIFFLTAEVVARLVLPPQLVKRAPQILHRSHPGLGWEIEPNQNAYTFSFPVTINSGGFRYREIAQEKPEGVTRILCIGDSLTFGAGVPTEETYPAQLERLLNQYAPSSQFEVINMGVFGYGTWQAVDLLKQKGLKYHPDIVILGFYINDPEDTLRYYGHHLQDSQAETPHNESGGEPSEQATPATSPGMVKRVRQFLGEWLKGRRLLPRSVIYLLQNSRFAYYIGWRINQLVVQESLEPQLLTGDLTPEIDSAWTLVDEALQELDRLRRQHHFKLMLIIFPSPMQMKQDFPQEHYQSKISALARKHAIPALDMLTNLRQAYTTFESLFIPYDGHPNGTVYAITAAQTREFLRTHLLSDLHQ